MGTATENTLFVMDTTANAKFPSRAHDIIVGHDGDVPLIKTYTFAPHQRLQMPFEHAVKFLKHKEFVVTKAEDGSERFDPTPTKPEVGTITLEPSQVIANLSELTVDALVIRCNQVPGGESLRKQVGKDRLIEFLIENADAVEANSAQDKGQADGGDDLVGDEMDPNELNHLLGED